jgi:hypothetical protein
MTINLQVGGVYATAEGIKHWITHLGGSGLFVTKHGKFYREDGQHYASIKSHYDLIRVISEPDAPTQAPAPDGVTVATINLQVGGVYATADGRETTISLSGYSESDHMFRGAPFTFTYDAQGVCHGYETENIVRVISEPEAPTEAPAPDGVTVTTKVTQIEICAPETETMPAVTYLLGINDDGVLSVTDGCGCGVTMSPAAARAIGAELIRMGGE